MTDAADAPEPAGRRETPDERHDRNWIELLNELRVAQTGVQLMAGFLLTLPFTTRFADLGHGYRTLYLVAFGLAVLATTLIVAPTTLHRVLYAHHRKGQLVRVSNRLAKLGLACLGGTLVSVAGLIFGVTAGTVAGAVAAASMALLALTLWWGLPTVLRNTGD
jgi:hypothetical protein